MPYVDSPDAAIGPSTTLRARAGYATTSFFSFSSLPPFCVLLLYLLMLLQCTTMKFVLLFAFAALFALANGSACTDACDASYTVSYFVFCSSPHTHPLSEFAPRKLMIISTQTLFDFLNDSMPAIKNIIINRNLLIRSHAWSPCLCPRSASIATTSWSAGSITTHENPPSMS